MKRNWYLAHREFITHYGTIPIDEHGRSYEIHHIDGNYSNNHIDNLIALTIDEHYEIHYWQNDKKACQAIMMRMKVDPEEIREIAREISYDRINNGTHPFQRRIDGSSLTSDRVKDGTNPWLTREDGTSVASDRVKDGTHNFIKREDDTSLSSDMVRDGSHHLLKRLDGTSMASDRVNDGTHHLLGENHHNFDKTIYTFKHDTGITECTTRSALIKKYDLDKRHVSTIIKNINRTHRGWKVIEN